MSTPNNNPLTRTLEKEAEHFDRTSGAAVSLDGVLNRAGEIRRGRRMRASIAMAAVVLAIAVPVGIRAIDADPTAKEPVPAGRNSHDHSQVTLDVPKAGHGPAIGYANGDLVHLANGHEIELGTPPVALAELNGGVLVSTNDEAGNLRAHYESPESPAALPKYWPMEGGFAVSPDGDVAAFVEPSGTVVIVEESGILELRDRLPRSGTYEAVAVEGSCDGTAGEAGCTVYVNQVDGSPKVWAVATTEASGQPALPGLVGLADVTSDEHVAGYTKVTDDGSCSEVREDSGAALWRTCEHRFSTFSPDGKHLLATGPYGSGAGDSELAVLDAQTGDPVLDLRTAPSAVITQMVWEDDDHVLAVVLENGRAGIVRFDLNGNRETALAPVPVVDDFISPVKLAER